MQCCPMRFAVRQHRELRRGGARHRSLAQKLYATLVSAARRLDCFGLDPLLSAIPDSNEDFVHY
ncbi:MAG: hypothetical protein ACTHJ1_10955 [Bordetella sp.]|uniref:hypothetical protein n=1 Tax=Bordetella sp. TaxID=28081 RepID=UPI003F7C9F62